MEKTKSSRSASKLASVENFNRLSTDVYLMHLDRRMYEVRGDIVGKILTFIEAISDNEQVTKARKDVISGILYDGLNKIAMQPQYEMEWLDRSLYDEETLKNNSRGSQYMLNIASTDSEEYEKDYVVKPKKI